MCCLHGHIHVGLLHHKRGHGQIVKLLAWQLLDPGSNLMPLTYRNSFLTISLGEITSLGIMLTIRQKVFDGKEPWSFYLLSLILLPQDSENHNFCCPCHAELCMEYRNMYAFTLLQNNN